MNAGEGAASQTTLLQSGLEMRSRMVLEEGLSRIDARTRSRLNQARQAAVTAVARPSWMGRFYGVWSRQMLMPATGAVAVAALVAVFMLSSGGSHLTASVADSPANALDVLDLVTDDDAMNLMEDNDSSFYEWAAAQGDGGGGDLMTASGGLRPVRAWTLGLLLGLPLQPLLLCAAEPVSKVVEPADEDLIEFLGSVDSDDEGWKQYLARTGVQAPAVKAPPPPAPPDSSAPGTDGPGTDGAKDEN